MLTGKKILSCNPEVWGGIECTINRVNDNFLDQLSIANFYQKPSVDCYSRSGY
jgi:hypothetical protein